jgi:hypothetical protein
MWAELPLTKKELTRARKTTIQPEHQPNLEADEGGHDVH